MKAANLVRSIAFLLLLIPETASALAQAGMVYEGHVLDQNTKEAIPYATVAFYNQQDLIAGMSTDDSGHFHLETTETITRLEVSFVGYEKTTFTTAVFQTLANHIISLRQLANDLDEVVVVGERTNTELKIDRRVIHLGADLQQSGTTALEAFDQLAEIQTDHSTGNITLRGSGNVRLLINGKPSALSPSEALAQIPASSIEYLELITSPSAKNQANGLSGIINILLKKDMEKGLNLSLNSALGTKRHSYGLNGNYNFSRMNIRWNASRALRDMDSHQTISQLYTNGNTRDFFAPHDFHGVTSKVAAGIDFFINPKNELSLGLDYTHDYHDFFNDTFYSNVTGRADYLYRRISSHTHKTLNTNLNYRKIFEPEVHFIEFDYNLTGNDNLLPAEDFEDGSFLFQEEKKNHNTLQALAIDYTRPLGKNIKLETGLSWNGREITSHDYFNFEERADTDHLFTYREDLFGIYSLVRAGKGKLNWQAGLRYEHFNSSSQNSADGQETDLTFSNLFPSVHASYQLNETNLLNFGYSKRASRPNFNHVNPFRMGNQYFHWRANPGLLPEFSHNLEANFQHNDKSFTWSASVFYHHRTDVIEWLQTIDEQGVKTVRFDNIGKKHATGIESSLSFQPTSFWDTQISANYYRTQVNQEVYITWNQLYSSSIILKNTFKIASNISTDFTYRYTGTDRNTFEQRRHRNRLDIAARVSLFKNRLTTNLRIIDALNDNLMFRKTVTPEVVQHEIWKFQSQTFGILFSVDYKLFQNKTRFRNRKKRDYRHGGSID
ncbi:MAG: TonB-dependent receptor [Roseivirga sp.]|nr:TonB-dependent receptor [Roseivirga sp.]